MSSSNDEDQYSGTIIDLLGIKGYKDYPEDEKGKIELEKGFGFIRKLMKLDTNSKFYEKGGGEQIYLDDDTNLEESKWIEFKEHRNQDTELDLVKRFSWESKRAITAFLNANGGILLYGVNDESHRITGCYLSSKTKDRMGVIFHEILRRLDPEVQPTTIKFHIWPLRTRNNDDGGNNQNLRKPYLVMIAVPICRNPNSNVYYYSDYPYTYIRCETSSIRFHKSGIDKIILGGNGVKSIPYSSLGQNGLKFNGISSENVPVGENKSHNIMNPLKLPIYNYKEDICALASMEEIRGFCIKGSTGCGKSTQVPLMLVAGLGNSYIIIAQPRRISCVRAAKTLSDQVGKRLGDFIGYKIGQNTVMTPETSIIFVTYGILRMILKEHCEKISSEYGYENNSMMKRCKYIIFDELHERSIDIDICLALARYASNSQISPKFIFMSATLPIDSKPMAELMSDFLPQDMMDKNGRTCSNISKLKHGNEILHFSRETKYHIPIVEINVSIHAMEYLYIDDPRVERLRKSYPFSLKKKRGIEQVSWPRENNLKRYEESSVIINDISIETMLSIIEGIYQEKIKLPKFKSGSDKNMEADDSNNNIISNVKKIPPSRKGVLIFVPGIAIIYELMGYIDSIKDSQKKYSIHILHSTIPLNDMQESTTCKCTNKYTRGGKGNKFGKNLTPLKIYIATNIAESSITLNDISFVIDFCTRKIPICSREQLMGTSSLSEEKLLDVWGSIDNLTQTAGRAGRVGPSCIFRLIPRGSRKFLKPRQFPDIIIRSPLQVVLLLTEFKQIEFDNILKYFPDKPEYGNIEHTINRLINLGAIEDRNGRNVLTDLGNVIVKFPLTPEAVIFLIYMVALGYQEEGVILACIISRKTVIISTSRRPELTYAALVKYSLGCRSDVIAAYNAYIYWLRNRSPMCSKISPLAQNYSIKYSEDTNYAEYLKLNPEYEKIWLNNYAWISLYNLRELDDLVLDCRKRAYKCGFISTPPDDWELSRKQENAQNLINDLEENEASSTFEEEKEFIDNTDEESSDYLEESGEVMNDLVDDKDRNVNEIKDDLNGPNISINSDNIHIITESDEHHSGTSESDDFYFSSEEGEVLSDDPEFISMESIEERMKLQKDIEEIIKLKKDAEENEEFKEKFNHLDLFGMEDEDDEINTDFTVSKTEQKNQKEKDAIEKVITRKKEEESSLKSPEENININEVGIHEFNNVNVEIEQDDDIDVVERRDWLDTYVNKPIDELGYVRDLSQTSLDYIHMREDNCYKCDQNLDTCKIPPIRRPLPKKALNKIAEFGKEYGNDWRPRFIPPISNYEKALLVEICLFLSHINSSWKVGYEYPRDAIDSQNLLKDKELEQFREDCRLEEDNCNILKLYLEDEEPEDNPDDKYFKGQPKYLSPPAKYGNSRDIDNINHSLNNFKHIVEYHTNIKDSNDFDVVNYINGGTNREVRSTRYVLVVKNRYYETEEKTLEDVQKKIKDLEKKRPEKVLHIKVSAKDSPKFSKNDIEDMKITKKLIIDSFMNLDASGNVRVKAVSKVRQKEDGTESKGNFLSLEEKKIEDFRMNPCAYFKVFPLNSIPIPLDVIRACPTSFPRSNPLSDYATVEISNKLDSKDSKEYKLLSYIPSSKEIITSVKTRDTFFDSPAKLSVLEHCRNNYSIRETPMFARLSLCQNLMADRNTLKKGGQMLLTLINIWGRTNVNQYVKFNKLPYELRVFLQLVNREGLTLACSSTLTKSRPRYQMLTTLPFGYPQMRSILLYLGANFVSNSLSKKEIKVPGGKPLYEVNFGCDICLDLCNCNLFLRKKELKKLEELRNFLIKAREEYSKLAIDLSTRDYRIQERYTKHNNLISRLQNFYKFRPITLSHDLLSALGFGVGIYQRNVNNPYVFERPMRFWY